MLNRIGLFICVLLSACDSTRQTESAVTNIDLGYRSISKIPDREFVAKGAKFLNSISTYQPHTARQQFIEAELQVWVRASEKFRRSLIEEELSIIERDKQWQILFLDPKSVEIKRYPEFEQVVLRISGKMQQGQHPTSARAPQDVTYYLVLHTVPANLLNQDGIVVVDYCTKGSILKNIVDCDSVVMQNSEEKLSPQMFKQ